MRFMVSSLPTRKIVTYTLIAMLFVSLLAVFGLHNKAAHAASVVTYPLPGNLPGSDASNTFSVAVNDQTSGVYTADGVSYTTFSTDGSVTVQVTYTSTISNAVIRPKSLGISPSISGNTLSFTMQSDQKVSVEVNNWSDTLLVAADPLESNPPGGPSSSVAYFGPGFYDLGNNWCFPNGVNELYIAGGAYVKGVINCGTVSGLTIDGRGVFSSEGYPGSSPYYGTVWFNEGSNITLDGITFTNLPGYGLVLDAYQSAVANNNLVNDTVVINTGLNHSGIHELGNNSTAQNSLVWVGDDAAIISDGISSSTFKNLVIATTNGDAIQMGWNSGGANDVLDGADIIHYTGGNYDGTQAAIGSIGFCQASDHPINNVTVKNVRVEGPLTRLFGLAAQKTDFCGSNPVAAPIENITFSNITSEQNGSDSNVIFGSNSSATVHDISFQNLTIAGQQITSATQGNFSIGAYTSNITFNGTSTGSAHFQGAPAAVSAGSGSLDVFVRGTDNQQWQRWYRNGSWSSSWASQGSPSGGLADSLAASTTNGNDTTFARGSDGTLWQISWQGSNWSSWTSLGGPTNNTFQGVPAAVSGQFGDAGSLDVFVRGTDNNLWQRWYRNGSWSSSWANLGAPSGGLASSPGAAVLNGNDTIFAQGTDGTLWQISWAGSGWSSWTSLGGPTNNTFQGVPTAVSSASGALDVFVRGTDNNLWQRWYRNSSWSSSWATQGSPSGGLVDSPAATALDGNDTIFARGSDGTLWQISWAGSGWSSWTSLGGPN